jgi:poly(beta-D-mannuronate) lyase
MKKKLFIFLCVCTCFCTFSCESKEEKKDPPVVEIDHPAVELAGEMNSSAAITVISNVQWAASSSEAWCECAPSTGKGTLTVSIKATEKNTSADSRNANVDFKVGGKTIKTLVVTQQGTPITPTISVSPSSYSFSDAAGSYRVNVTSNSSWTAVSSVSSFCTVVPAAGTGNGSVTVHVTANDGNTSRDAIVTFAAGTGTDRFTVQQSAPSTPDMVRSLTEFTTAQASATPGTVIIWADGHYDLDGLMIINKDGITVKAETDGGVVFTGSSRVKVEADNIVFRGFQFKDGAVDNTTPSDYTGSVDLFVVGNGKSGSSGLTNATKGNNNKFEQLNFYNVACRQMVCITPGASDNVFEYCNFEAKPKVPANSVFQIQVSTDKPGRNIVRYCSFKNFLSGNTGDYGMEAIRIGYSHQKDNISHDVIEYCYFYHCGGDDEIISSKATETVYRYNTFDDNGFTDPANPSVKYKSHLCIRHGQKSSVYGNFFINGGRGLRICEGTGHVVYNNYFNTAGNWPFRIDNRDGADAVTNVTAAHNTFTGCAPLELHSGNSSHTILPSDITMANNIFSEMTSSSSFTKYMTGNEKFVGDILYPDVSLSATKPLSGLRIVNPNMTTNSDGYKQLQSTSTAAIDKSSDDYPSIPVIPGVATDSNIVLDIMKNTRPASRTQKDIGCFEFGGGITVKPHAMATNTGPAYLH